VSLKPVKSESTSTSSPRDVFIVTPDPQLLHEYLRSLKNDEISTLKVEKREELTTQATTTTTISSSTVATVLETTTEEEENEEYGEIDIDYGLKPSCIATLCASG
jgi:hypothetical protein